MAEFVVEGKQVLSRVIKLPSAISFIVGAIIGSGIFASPGSVLRYSGSVFHDIIFKYVSYYVSLYLSFATIY